MQRDACFNLLETLIPDNTLSSTAKLLLARLLRYYNPETGQCNPKIHTLMQQLGRCDRTVRRVINQLVRARWINKHRGQHGLSYEILIGQKCPIRADKNVRSGRTKMSDQNAPYPYMKVVIERRKGNKGLERPVISGLAYSADSPPRMPAQPPSTLISQNSTTTTPLLNYPQRKATRSQPKPDIHQLTLEAYYEEERRRAQSKRDRR